MKYLLLIYLNPQSRAIWEGFVGPVPTPRYGPAPEDE